MTIIAINLKTQDKTEKSLLEYKVEGINIVGTFNLDGSFSPLGDGDILMWESSEVEVVSRQSEALETLGIEFTTGTVPEKVCSEMSGLPVNTAQMMEESQPES